MDEKQKSQGAEAWTEKKSYGSCHETMKEKLEACVPLFVIAFLCIVGCLSISVYKSILLHDKVVAKELTFEEKVFNLDEKVKHIDDRLWIKNKKLEIKTRRLERRVYWMGDRVKYFGSGLDYEVNQKFKE